MSSCLADVYATLTRKYGSQYTVTYNVPPTYLVQIVGEKEASSKLKIILVYLEDKSKVKSVTFFSPSKLKKKVSSSDLDLTGSPLKDDCNVETIDDISSDINVYNLNPWKIEEEFHKGILLEKAKSIISDEELQKSIGQECNGSIWFLCDGCDADKTIMLQYDLNVGYFSRGLVKFLGVFPAYTVNTQTILQQHFRLVKLGSPIKTFIENTYEIKPTMLLRCSWSSVANIPSLIDLSKCDVVLSQKFQFENCAHVTQDFVLQLRVLMNIRDEIISYNRSKKLESGQDPQYVCGSGIEIDELRKSINEVMTEVSGFSPIDALPANDVEDVVNRAKIRNLIDVTDKLWDILKSCSSYRDLKLSLNMIFQCAARCNVVNTPNNKNRLAEIITEVANRRLAIPCLSGSEPLELLLEIGMEKLYKDYEFIVTESKICSANFLKNFYLAVEDSENKVALPNVRKSLRNAARQSEMASSRKSLLHTNVKISNKYQSDDVAVFRNSNFDEKETAIRIARLLHIHCSIEHILMVHINLNLSSVYPDLFQKLLRRPLRFVDYIHDSYTDEMEISLSVQDIREHLEGKDPHMRRVIVKSESKFQHVTTTFFYCMNNVCPPGISENFQCEGQEYTKDNMYYCWLHHRISRFKN